MVLATGLPALGQELLITNARIVDVEGLEIRQGSLLIRDGRIAAELQGTPDGYSGEVLDTEGRWIIPGLNDLHTHSYGNMGPGGAFDSPGKAVVADRILYCGVTGFLDLFGGEDSLWNFRQSQQQGEAGGSTLFASLSCLTATKGHCTEYGVPTRTMDSPDEARAVVTDLARRQPDVVKIVYSPRGRMPSIDEATLQAAVATATESELRTVIHVNSWEGVAEAVNAGASAVTHVPSEGPVPEDLARLMADRGVAHIPTLAVETDFAHFVADPAVLDDPLARAVAPATILDAYRSQQTIDHAAQRAEQAAQSEALILASVKTLARAGVVMLTGTDSGNWGTLQGYSVHRELEKLVKAGLSPWEALAASTVNAGEFLGRDWGLAAGDEANLVVLDASPIDDIRNTREIFAVVHYGEIVDRQGLLPPDS